MPPYWPSDGRAVEVVRVVFVYGHGGLGKTRLLGEVPHLDAAAVEARALALVEVERRPAGDGRDAWSAPIVKLAAACAPLGGRSTGNAP